MRLTALLMTEAGHDMLSSWQSEKHLYKIYETPTLPNGHLSAPRRTSSPWTHVYSNNADFNVSKRLTAI